MDVIINGKIAEHRIFAGTEGHLGRALRYIRRKYGAIEKQILDVGHGYYIYWIAKPARS